MKAEIESFERLPLKYVYQFLGENGYSEKVDEIRSSKEQYKSYTSTLRRAKFVNFLDEKRILDDFIKEY